MSHAKPPAARPPKYWLAYSGMIAGAIAAFVIIERLGRDLGAPGPVAPHFGAGRDAAAVDVLLHVLLALVVVVVAARALGAVFKRIGQPPVIGELVAGIVLGPSVLGRVAPDIYAVVLPASVAPFLGILAQVGVILFMFLVGLELDTGLLAHRTRATVAISHASILAPFLLGSTLALFLYPRLSSRDVPFGVLFAMMVLMALFTTFLTSPLLQWLTRDREGASGEESAPLPT